MTRPNTHYDTLQVSPQASTAVIRAAFKALSQKWHPDKNPNNLEMANKKFHAIKLAYDVLSDIKLRETYDQQNQHPNHRNCDKKANRAKILNLRTRYSTRARQRTSNISIIT